MKNLVKKDLSLTKLFKLFGSAFFDQFNKNSKLLIDHFQNGYEKVIIPRQIKRIGITSFSLGWENILLWSHYANKHEGFCIGFLEDYTRKEGFFGFGASITYTDKIPKINPMSLEDGDFIFKHYCNKYTDWKYEEEYRLGKYFINPPTKEQRTVSLPDSAISEIMLGLCISEEHKNEIIGIARKRNIPVYQAVKIDGKFEVGRELII